MLTKNFELVIKSEVCVQPGMCYPVDTYLPAWITLLLATTAVFVLKDFYYLIKR